MLRPGNVAIRHFITTDFDGSVMFVIKYGISQVNALYE